MHKLYNAWFSHPFLKGNQMVNISLQIIICTLVTILKLWTSNIKKQKKGFPDKLQFTSYISRAISDMIVNYHTFLQWMQLPITHSVVAEVNSVSNAVERSQKIK